MELVDDEDSKSHPNYDEAYLKFKADVESMKKALNDEMARMTDEKAIIQRDMRVLTDRIAKINEGIARRKQTQCEYDKAIEEMENAHITLVERSKKMWHDSRKFGDGHRYVQNQHDSD